jgi:outer membrane lipoprotein SlyB
MNGRSIKQLSTKQPSNRLALATLAAAALMAGCATPSQSGGAYSQSQTRHEMTVRLGVVESVRPVRIEGNRETPAGTIAGGAVGAAVGGNVGGGRGSTLGTIVGAVAGAVAGNAIERNATEKNGFEITVKLEGGQMIAITQEADEQFRPGERVRVLSGGGATRVAH